MGQKRAAIIIVLMTVSMLAGSASQQELAFKSIEGKKHSAITPVRRTGRWWGGRHDAFNERLKKGNVDLLFIGDSITQGWEKEGEEIWAMYYEPRNAVNMGISGDRTQHVLWRLDHSNFENVSPKLAVLLIGVNNSGDNTAEEIADGTIAICQRLRTMLPKTKILLLAIFPTKSESRNQKNATASLLASRIADRRMIHYLDIHHHFLTEKQELTREVMPDGVHPNKNGYKIWAEAVESKIVQLMGSATIHIAASVGDLGSVKTLVRKGIDINSADSNGRTALHYAAKAGHINVAEFLITKQANVNAKDKTDETPLNIAVVRNREDIIKLLLAKGADVDVKNASGEAPLHSAAKSTSKDIVELLITAGAEINVKNNDGQTPLDIALSQNRKDIEELLRSKGGIISSIHVAAQMGDLGGVKALLEQGTDVNAQDDKGDTALHYAVHGGHKELVEFLIAKGADVNSKDKYGYSPLFSALWYENKDIIKLLVTKGADVNLKPEKDYPPLHYAVWNEDIDTVELLVANGAKFDVKDQDGWTAFRYAAAQGNRDIVEFFITKGADVSSFHMAACMGDLPRVKLFVEQGADVDTKDELGWTPLYWAASTGQENVAEFLIANGADVNAKINDSSTTLFQAAATDGLNFVQLLIAKGADVNAKDKHGNTPLHSAASAGQREVVELLISKGAIVDVKGRNCRTPLYNAALRGHKDIVEILVAKGADIDAKDKSERTALHMATTMGRKDTAALLIAKGADINRRNANGQTPLHLSASQGRKDMVGLLITKGADVKASNKWNRTPLDIAVDRGHTEIVDLLRKHSESEAVKTDSKALKVLFIGNSYTGGIRGTLDTLIGVSPYSESTLEYAVKGGWTLQQHLNDVSTISRIKANKWDYVVLQEQSKAPTLPEKCDDFYNAVVKLSTIIRQYGSRPVLYMTWGRRDKDEENPQINPDYETMQMRLTKAYTDVARKANALIAPVGEAWRAVRRERLQLGSQLYRDDGSHPSEKGAYLAACVFYATLFKADPMQLNFNSSLSVGEAEYLKAKAVEAVRSINRDKDSPAP